MDSVRVLPREVEPYRRARWPTASRVARCAIVAALVGAGLFLQHERDTAAAARHPAETLHLQQAIDEVRTTQASLACLRYTLSELGQRDGCDWTPRDLNVDRDRARRKLARLKAERRELLQRIAQAKALAAQKRVHISTECIDNPLTCL